MTAQRGIPHIESLPVNKFISMVQGFNRYVVSEKIDGSNIQFGIDDDGRFYTSRENFGTPRKYALSEYDIDFSTTFQRYAHAAIESRLGALKEAGFGPGDCAEVEVLYGELPNVVQYSKDINRIVLLRVVKGDIDIKHIHYALINKEVVVDLLVPYTLNGVDILTEMREEYWKFCITPTVLLRNRIKGIQVVRLAEEVKKMDEFLCKPSGVEEFTNKDILTLPLNKCPEGVTGCWGTVKTEMRTARDELREIFYVDHTKVIKNLLLYNLVSGKRSVFGKNLPNYWIEGVVLRHLDTGEQIKIVDKYMFMQVKDFIWEERDRLQKRPKTIEHDVLSVYGNLLLRLGNEAGFPELATTQASKRLKTMEFDTKSDDELASIKKAWLSEIRRYKNAMPSLVDSFTIKSRKKVCHIGRHDFRYCKNVNSRTMEVFAVMNQRLAMFEENTSSATEITDLAQLLVNNGHYKDKK